ncbi:PREDICTED: olfactory receptor 6F1-like [Nestor notabilis]|uniref:olfactory receptor 6F1-like n=1 Tax=Nestor notabilis TaxID=176057 RepID=UPI0005237CFB|nr:PREDICTED: olfactory receptor 6F1-like [Nestor notabilis]
MSLSSDVQRGNHSATNVFILLGFPGRQQLKTSLFVLFFIMYILALLGNLSIMVVVRSQPQLHTPMYFFLCNLSFLEIWYITTCVPKALAVLLGGDPTISFMNCLLQMYFVFSLGCTEYFLLAAMAYDRCLAICFPLHYNSIMNRTLLTQLAFGSWFCGFLFIAIPTYMISTLSFCGPNVINHFFCDIAPWIVLSCTDTTLLELVAFIIAFIVILGSCTITLVSYIYIISTILRIPSAIDQQRAFSTCFSHLTVVIIWYGSTIFLHVKPSIKDSLDYTKTVHVLNTIVTPLLNPYIYSLRNKEVKKAFKRTLQFKKSCA